MATHRLIYLLVLVPLLLAAEGSDPGADPKIGEVAKRMLELETREAALRTLEQDLDRKIEKLAELLQDALDVIAPEERARKEQLETLISFYQAMKPKNAARLLEKLPMRLAANVLGSMGSREAGKILNVMNTDRAVRISKLMAGEKR